MSSEDILEAVRRVAREVGASGQVSPLLADAMHPVWRAGPFVVRLEVDEIASEVARRVENCARMCAAGVPFVVPARDEPIPVPGFADLVATVWEYAEPTEPLDWSAFGRAVRALHDFSALSLPFSRPLPERLARAVDNHSTLDPEVAGRFRAMVSTSQAVLDAAGWEDLPLAPSHGDLWTKNVVPRGAGCVVLCDPDFLGLRPVASDLAMVHRETAGDQRWERFADAYGSHLIPPTEQLAAGLRASILNWTTYVLDRRPDWTDYIEELSIGGW